MAKLSSKVPSLEQVFAKPNLKNSNLCIDLIKALMASNISTVFTGKQGSGKTVALSSASQYILKDRCVIDNPEGMMSAMIVAAQNNRILPVFTCDANSPVEMMEQAISAVLKRVPCKSNRIATTMVTNVVKVNVHLDVTESGKHVIERIVEITPASVFGDEGYYSCVELIEFDYEKNAYIAVNSPSEELTSKICNGLPLNMSDAFQTYINRNFDARGE